ncbi:uncharacterized protein NEMAJ01_2195 [Nematocida major]|uniref:uncharacterized protein n=1 Tax=Nematocida major TaxID=1912982 RepID=UPI00200897B0|nr:uncharacterized protein NEMAJ01_2195 [Nematocida major]KAH9387299.1 hypothetical protein NEMAJ01_2195 [Nematocida major]
MGAFEREKCKKSFSKAGARVTSGIKYGTDYLVYLGEPGSVHSLFTLNSEVSASFRALSALVRVSSSAKKDFVMCAPDGEGLFVRFSRFFL